MNLDTKIAIPTQVMAREASGETVLLDLASGTYFGIDAVGTRIWALLGEGKTLGQVAAIVAEEYDVDLAQVEADTVEFTTELLGRGLVETAS